MEDEVESITDVRVRMYLEALAEAEENKLAKEAENQPEENPEAETVKRSDEPGSDRTHSSAQEDSDKV